MATWTLADIRQKVRQVTGRYSQDELTNDRLDQYINQYYEFEFPAEVKLEQKHTFYEFTTLPNQSYYDTPDLSFTNYEPPATVNNLDMLWYQNPAKFVEDNVQTALQYNFTTPWTGDGVTVTFNTTVTGFPIMPATLTIADSVESFWDQSQTWTTANVVFAGTAGGTATINYSTGVVSVNFKIAPSNGDLIHLNYVVFQAGRPQAILYYNNQFQLLPPPDQVYVVKMGAYSVVTPLVLATDTPDLPEWGPCIAYGASRAIFADYGENESYMEITALYKEQVGYVLTRTEQDLLNTRAFPNF